MALHGAIERVLFTADEIAGRVKAIAAEITTDFKSQSDCLVLIAVATGACLFFADLIRLVDLPIAVDFVRAESYGADTVSNGATRISSGMKLNVLEKHVILVEDIVDTGGTLSYLIEYMRSKGASSVSVCSCLDKPARRKFPIKLIGGGKFYRGFECPDYFVVGYGMDFAELFRNLPYIGVLKPEYYEKKSCAHDLGITNSVI